VTRIPKENENKIFKPLFTTKPKGQIAFESEIGKGSKFTIKVPIKTRRPKGGK
jgi:signal transduction histidine kinase